MYDSAGDLERVMLARGNVVSVWRQHGVGETRLGLVLPGQSGAWVTSWSSSGHLTLVTPPGREGVVVMRRSGAGRLESVVAGDRDTEYHYDEVTGDIVSVDHDRAGVSIKTSLHYSSKERFNHIPLFSLLVIPRLTY